MLLISQLGNVFCKDTLTIEDVEFVPENKIDNGGVKIEFSCNLGSGCLDLFLNKKNELCIEGIGNNKQFAITLFTKLISGTEQWD